jgi:formate dehydrogenase subunit gamma
MAKIIARARIVVGALALLARLPSRRRPQLSSRPRSIRPRARCRKSSCCSSCSSVQGRISIPDARAGVLIQPAGQSWRQFHQVTLPWIGAIAILGVLIVLVLFYLMRGMVKIENGRSGRTSCASTPSSASCTG